MKAKNALLTCGYVVLSAITLVNLAVDLGYWFAEVLKCVTYGMIALCYSFTRCKETSQVGQEAKLPTE